MLANPVRLENFLSATSAAIRVDQRFNVVSLADELRGLSTSAVTFTTVPLANTNYITPSGQSAVLWNSSAAAALFNGLKNDQAPSAPGKASPAHPASAHTLRRSQVSLDVYNGTFVGGLSAAAGQQLTALGFTVHQSGIDWTSQNVTQTVIQYPAGQRAAAALVRQAIPGAALQRVKGLTRVRVVLGANDHTVTAPSSRARQPRLPRARSRRPPRRTPATDPARPTPPGPAASRPAVLPRPVNECRQALRPGWSCRSRPADRRLGHPTAPDPTTPDPTTAPDPTTPDPTTAPDPTTGPTGPTRRRPADGALPPPPTRRAG